MVFALEAARASANSPGAGREIWNFKNPDRPVPENSLSPADFGLVLRNSLSANVNCLPSLSDAFTRGMRGRVPALCASLQLVRLDVVDG